MPAPHLELFEGFADAVGAPAAADASPATVRFGESVHRLWPTESPVAALASLAAYEIQAAEIAGSKAEGLRLRYGVTDDGCALLGRPLRGRRGPRDVDRRRPGCVAADSDEVRDAASAAASAWWAFLDEREAQAPVALTC